MKLDVRVDKYSRNRELLITTKSQNPAELGKNFVSKLCHVIFQTWADLQHAHDDGTSFCYKQRNLPVARNLENWPKKEEREFFVGL